MKYPYTLILAMLFVASVIPGKAARQPKKVGGAMSETARMEYRANNMISQGLDLLEAKQEERALKLLQDVPRLFPKAAARFKAYLSLGKYYASKRDFPRAIKQYTLAQESEKELQKAESLYQTGICYYNLNQHDRAFVSLRKVVNLYPATVFANESYYYIGLCHFKLGRWARAVESLEKVGTSTTGDTAEIRYAESGQRFFAKVFDSDLVVLVGDTDSFEVSAKSAGGDEEQIVLSALGKDGSRFIGSLPTALGAPAKGDGIIQIKGGDEITISYVDVNTSAGTRNQTVLSRTTMVSSASIGFTDGAYREYTSGVFAEQPCFIRVKDWDADVSDQADTLSVEVYCQFKPEKEVDVEKSGIDIGDEDELEKRTIIPVTLTETGAHTGLFTASIPVKLVEGSDSVPPAADALYAKAGDHVVLAYKDMVHIVGDEPRDIVYTARILTGQVQDVDITISMVADAELRARKNLIEARLQLRLGEVFKDVGLNEKATAKAQIGLDKAQDVIKIGLKTGINRDLIEQAYNVKWDLLIVQGKLHEAIRVCNQLVRLFPDSTLVDAALMKIGHAKAASDDPAVRREAESIYNSVIRLPKSTLKAEAQYRIAELREDTAVARAGSGSPKLANVMLAYKKVADNYPDSNFAGDALEKVANYYIKSKDYGRAVALMEQVFQDYPDASFLDSMLYKWALSSYRLQDYQAASDKCDELLSDYPNSSYAVKAKKIQTVIQQKL
ncbi:MAG: TolA-binding protein [Rhodothermales bacterium]|jgi:TolA-binding protein